MRVIIVDDEQANVEYFSRTLREHEIYTFNDPTAVVDFCRSQSFDVVVADQKMPGCTGIDLIKQLAVESNDFIGIIVSAYTDVPDLVEAVNSNIIYKYIVKPFAPELLQQYVKQGIELLQLKRENLRLTEELKKENIALRNLTSSPLDSFVGFHPDIEKVKELSRIYAGSDFPVLISGETGTGKELIARAIHNLSGRKEKNFVAINCSAFSEQLLESELFGHEKGAFTGADLSKKGLVWSANGGTLFLDEIGDFPLALQPKILRFIQFGTFYPLGSAKEKKVDVRIISATNKDLKQAVQHRLFRRDLLFRINSLHIKIPPLRKRPKDVFFILESLAARRGLFFPQMTEGAKLLLKQHSFPGNVRELEGIIEKINLHSRTHTLDRITESLLADFLDIQADMTHSEILPPQTYQEGPEHNFSLAEYLAHVEEDLINRFFEKNNRNITRTAKELGVSRQGLKNKFRRYGIPFGNSHHNSGEIQ